MLELLSLDVWDTLLRRRCAPNAIKLQTCLHLLMRYRPLIAPAFATHWQLFHERQRHEDALAQAAHRAGDDDEYTINELFTAWLGSVLTDAAAVPALVEALVSHELKAEFAHSYPDPDIAALIEAYGARQRVFISDFYIDQARIHQLLHDKGLGHYFTRGFCSCDHRRNKNSGRLFAHVHQTLGVIPANHLHIGDHPHADFANARRAGMQSVLYRPARETARRQIQERLFLERGNLLRHLDTLTARNLAKAKNNRPAEDPVSHHEEIGRQAVVLLLACCLRIAQTALTRGAARITFATDSSLLRLGFGRLFPDNRFAGLTLPECVSTETELPGTLRITLAHAALGPDDLNPAQPYCAPRHDTWGDWQQLFASPCVLDPQRAGAAAAVQRGMLFALDTWQEFAETYALTADELDEPARRIASHSPFAFAPEQIVISETPGDHFGQQGYFSEAELPTLGNFMRVPYSSQARAKLHRFLAEIDEAPHSSPLRTMGPLRRSTYTLLLNLVRKVRRESS